MIRGRRRNRRRSRSIYICIHDGQGRYLISKKRIRNSWWNYRSGNEQIVHQAGQWSLPGGRLEGSSYMTEAIREFEEETGVRVSNRLTYQDWLIEAPDYVVAEFSCPWGTLNQICTAANSNLAPDPRNPARPYGEVKDWELSEVRIVFVGDIRQYLGERVRVADPAVDPNEDGQKIGWYEDIGNVIRDRAR